MAGYDQKPPHFVIPAGDPEGIRGKAALNYINGPEGSQPEDYADETVFLQSIRNVLADLLAVKDQVLNPNRPPSRPDRGGMGM